MSGDGKMMCLGCGFCYLYRVVSLCSRMQQAEYYDHLMLATTSILSGSFWDVTLHKHDTNSSKRSALSGVRRRYLAH